LLIERRSPTRWWPTVRGAALVVGIQTDPRFRPDLDVLPEAGADLGVVRVAVHGFEINRSGQPPLVAVMGIDPTDSPRRIDHQTGVAVDM
jgi:hypothetical protein